MALSIRVTDFQAEGIKVIPATDDGFDALARPLIGRVADIGLQLKPLLFVVSNESPHTIVSFSKTWTVRYEDGRTMTMPSHTSFPEYVCGDVLISHAPLAFPPDSRRVETPSVEIQGYAESGPYFDQFLPQFVVEKDQILANATELHIELNAVIFADGRIIGPDPNGELSGLFSEYVSAKQDWYRQILDRLDAGCSVDDAYGPIKAFQKETSRRAGRAVRDVFKIHGAAEAARWIHRFKNDEVPALLRQSIHLEPFVIRRLPS
jgi:hypothetical protein